MTMADKLGELRKEKGLSQLQLAEMLGVSRQAISRWEMGTAAPSAENIKYLAQIYNVSLEHLMFEDGERRFEAVPTPGKQAEPKAKEKSRLTRERKIIIALSVLIFVLVLVFVHGERNSNLDMTELQGEEVVQNPSNRFDLEW